MARRDWPASEEFIHRCIGHEAWRCYRKLPWYSVWSIKDLEQEGLLVAARLRRRYEKRRGRFTTLLVPSLRNHFADLMHSEWTKKKRLGPGSPRLTARLNLQMDEAEDPAWALLEVFLQLPADDVDMKLEFDRIRHGFRTRPRPETPAFQRLRWHVYWRLWPQGQATVRL